MAPIFFLLDLTGRCFLDTTKGWRWCWKNVGSETALGFNRKAPFPVAPDKRVDGAAQIRFHPPRMLRVNES